jgi:uncharacterized protein
MTQRRLPRTSYLAFPFRIDGETSSTSDRREHVREQIAQVLFTAPGERLFLPEFGVGLQRLVFEPNTSTLWELTRKRLMAALIDALRGEVDQRTLEVAIEGRDEASRSTEQALEDSSGDPGTRRVGDVLEIRIRYQLAALGEREEQVFTVTSEGTHG